MPGLYSSLGRSSCRMVWSRASSTVPALSSLAMLRSQQKEAVRTPHVTGFT